MAKKSYEMDLTSGPILPRIFSFALPLMASSLLQLLFNTADTIVVGRFAGDTALAAVGSTGALINLLTTLFMGLSIGSNVLVSRYYASRQDKQASEVVHTSMCLALLSGILLTFVGIFSARWLLQIMSSPEDVIDLAAIYLRVYFIGMTAMMLYNFGAAILRSIGDTRRPLYFLTLSGIINVILNLIFVIIFHMSVMGVALATIISQFISCGMLIRCMIQETSIAHLDLRRLRLNLGCCWDIIRIGFPAGLQGMIFTGSNFIIQSSINSFGSVTVAGNAAASSLEGFTWMAMNSIQQTAVSFVAQNHGAKKYDRLLRVIVDLQISVFAFGFVIGNTILLFHNFFLGLYTTSPEVIKIGMIRLAIMCSLHFLCGMMDVMGGSLRGLGFAIMPTVVTLAGVIGIRIVWIFTFFRMERFHNIQSLYYTYPVSWTLTLLLHIICLRVVWKKVISS
ncbi:MAG: MATE family efflux transporter [Clostridiales bacterium]|nr:MATE family efflux transporter [Candidatus Blautia equi]